MHGIKNTVQLIGNLGQAPEIGTTEKGRKYARFSIATNESYRDTNGQKKISTNWHRLVAWGKPAEIAEKFFTKGKEIAVSGKLVSRNFIDKSGVKRYTTEVLVGEVLMLGAKSPVMEEED